MTELPDTFGLISEPKASVLLVDDDPANLLLLRSVLEDLGQNLVEVSSGEEAIERVKTDDFAVVLLDVLMPGLDGYETAQAIRQYERSRHTPIIFVTASDIERQHLERGYSLGAVDFLVKPLLPLAVKVKVRSFVQLFLDKRRAKQDTDQLRLLVQGTTEYAIFMLDPHGRVASWNTGAERLKGYKPTEIIGQHFSKFYPQEAIDRGWPAHELKVAKVEGRFEDEGWRLRKDGTQFWANVIITALHDEAGNFVGYSKITRDLTERKHAEESARRLIEETTARRMAEENARLIQEQKERLHVTLASIGDAVISTDAQGQVDFLNPVAEELVGWTTTEAKNRPLTEVFRIVNEATRQSVENPALRALKEGTIVGLANHTILIAKDGTERPIDDSAAPIRDAGGNIFGSVLVFRDISKRKQVEEALKTSGERLSLALSAAALGDWSWDAANDMVTLSERAADIFGIPPGPHMTWTKMRGLLHADDREKAKREVERAVAEHSLYAIDYRISRQDGTYIWVNALGRALYDEAGTVTGMYGVVQDITPRKQLVESLRQSEQHFRSLMEQSPFSVQLFSPDGRTVRVNRAWEELWGLTLDQIASYNVLEDKQLEAKGISQFLRRAFDGEAVEIPAIEYDVNETIPAQSNHQDPRRWVTAVAYPIKDESGTIREVVLVHEDITARKRAEAAVVESEEKLRLLANTIPQLAWMARPDGHIFWYNQRSYEYTGMTQEQLDGWGWQALLDSEMSSKVLDGWKAAIASGEPFEMVFPLKGADEQFRLFLTRVNPLKDEEGRVRYWFGTNTDITDQKRAEIALRESEQRFRQLADAMPQIVWTAQPDGQIDYQNRRWCEFTGLPATTGNDGWAQILHPDDASPAAERWAASLHSGNPFEMEVRLLDRRQQSYRWHLIRTVAVHDDAGAVAHWFGTSTDIDEQKRAEESSRFLAEASAALAGVVDYESTLQKVANLAVPYFADWSAVDMANEDGTLRRLAVAHQGADKIGLAHELMKQYPPDPQSPTGALAVLHTGKPEIVAEITDEMLVQGTKDERHLQSIRSLGLRSYICVPLVVSGNPLGVLTFATAKSGRPYTDADLALANDLANRAGVAIENIQLYQALRDADRRKDEFLATLAHELRNPLAPIRNSLQVLKMPRVEPSIVEQTREVMERQVHHLVRLVDDLLDVSRVMRGKIELRREPVELATIIARAVETAMPLIEVQGHEFDISVAKESLLLDADPIRLTQVVGNLLTNAAKYTESKGHIWLTAKRQADVAVLTIRDTGIGIAPDMLPHVFDLFVQADHSSTKAQGGLGIGLTLVKSLVEMHGGSVAAASNGLGTGSEFTIRLPVMAQPTSAPDDGNELKPAALASGHRLLVVDDNHDAALTLSMLMQLQGHEVRVANDGPTALNIASDFKPDMIFLDIGMPGMDGYEVARRVRQTPGIEKTVLAALTGWGQQEDRRRTAEAGFDHHLVKPCEPKLIEKLLADLKSEKQPGS